MTKAIFIFLVDVYASPIFIMGYHNFRCPLPKVHIYKDLI